MNHTVLEHLDQNGRAAAFNAVYEDYVMPVNVSAAHVDEHVRSNDINLAESPLWLDDNGAVVGMAMLGIREDRGWVGGFGIAKPYRGRGLSHPLMQEVIDRARSLGLRSISLEVITTNTVAIRTYKRAAFTHRRDLLILVRKPAKLTLAVDTSDVTQVDPAQALANRPSTTVAGSWQHEQTRIDASENLSALALGSHDAPLATIVYSVRTDNQIRINDVAAIDQNAAHTILAALIHREPDASISVMNEPEGSNALPALYDLGWIEVMRQHEMVLEI